MSVATNSGEQLLPTGLLPHEVAMAQSVYDEQKAKRDEAVALVAEALEVSGDWSENGPVFYAREGADNASRQMELYQNALTELPPVDYPAEDEATIAIGSYARINLSGEVLGVMVIGLSVLYDDSRLPHDDTVEEVTAMTTDSPLSAAIFGASVGDTFSYQPGSVPLEVSVIGIDQQFVRNHFDSSAILAEQ